MIEIRKAKIEDLDHLVILFEGYRKFYRQPALPEKATQFIKTRLENQDSVIYIAVDNSKKEIVGFTQLYPSYTSTRMQKTWILNDLFISPENRGQGISKLLINAAKQLCKETNTFGLMLETEKTNIIGNKLYPSVGFVKETNNFYYWINK